MEYITIAVAAELLTCSKAEIRKLIASAKIRGFKIGRLVRIEKESIMEIIAASAFKAQKKSPAKKTGEQKRSYTHFPELD